jgi:YebC/PmpR family DNA-binding regulatory protein
MAGHSKWKNIQHRKGAQDAKRGKIFTKIAVEIMVAARQGGGNPDDNPRLRLALAKAKSANMPKDNWLRALKRGTGEIQGADYVEKSYEGYGPGGVAVFVECLTDNVNRTVSEIRYAFSRSGGNLGQEGSVAWIFESKGIIIYPSDKIIDMDSFLEDAINQGAEDVDFNENQIEVRCTTDKYSELQSYFKKKIKLDPVISELSRIPKNFVEIESDKYGKLEKLIQTLESNEDVQNVYHNGQC